jgi:catechol 2,3-dioxygenase-like lactoylglutathione lyase family enzyme
MSRTTLSIVAAAFSLVAAAPLSLSAQTITAKGPVVYGHHHFNTTDLAAQKRFFVDTLGGKAATIGTNNLEVVEFPNVFLFFRPMQEPTGGMIGSTVNHIGFSVPDLQPFVAKIKANGFKMITSESVAATVKVTDDIAAASPTTNIAFALGPDDIKVELVEVKNQQAPIQLHHVHFFGEQRDEMRAWYAKTFGAAVQPAGPGQVFVTAQLPGVTLSFSPSPTPTVATQGRALDHIGFEVENLEAFTKKLEADGIALTVPYREVPALGISIAFIKDPWGTNIELTEGLAKIK